MPLDNGSPQREQEERREAMINTKNMSNRWLLWLGWVVTSTLGFAVGIGLSFAVPHAVSETAASVAFGLLTGLVQWLVLRKIFSQSGWWILANVLGIPLGFAATNAVHGTILWDGSPLLNGVLDFGIIGLVVGLAQWLVLQRHFRKAGFWIIVSAASWSVGGLVTWFINLQLSTLFTIIANYAVIGAIAGASTGLGLILLKKIPVAADITRKNWLGNLGIAGCALVLVITASVLEGRRESLGTIPDPSPGSTCDNLPPLECVGDDAYCTELVPFEPVTGPGYRNDPANGETWDNQYRSYLRRDLMMAIKYAAAKVKCETQDWDTSPFKNLGFGDMSEADGSIPGTSIGQPGHPMGTHENGNDIDVAYYQMKLPGSWLMSGKNQEVDEGNEIRVVCKHSRFRIDVFHCTEPPRLLDPWRTALFIASLSEHPDLRVIGVDGQVGPEIELALDQLVQSGWIDSDLRDQIPLAYEEIDKGWGWFLFHHHHMHISFQVRP
jgi:hypothetical protein